MLEIKNLSVAYGNIRAVREVSLSVNDGETVALIGANGAGKSTVLKTVSGLIKPASGEILLNGKSITNLGANQIVALSVAHVPEGRQVFSGMSVWENLRLGAYLIKDMREIERRMKKVFELFPIIGERRGQLAGTLSGGEQQMLAIGRGLMSEPKLLLLDEPSLGLAPIITKQVFSVLKSLKGDGTTMLIVEQNAYEALELSDRAYVMETGAVAMQGASEELLNDANIREAYLGR